MVNVILENGYFTGMACKIGKFENGVDVYNLPNETDTIKQRAYKLENGQWVFDETKYQELLKEQTTIDDKIVIEELRQQREVECFSIINRGQLWYSTLTEEKLTELQTWYNAWLDITETKFVPEKPSWIK